VGLTWWKHHFLQVLAFGVFHLFHLLDSSHKREDEGVDVFPLIRLFRVLWETDLLAELLKKISLHQQFRNEVKAGRLKEDLNNKLVQNDQDVRVLVISVIVIEKTLEKSILLHYHCVDRLVVKLDDNAEQLVKLDSNYGRCSIVRLQ